MKLLIQRVREASVVVDSKSVASIKSGLLTFVGIHHNDTQKEIEYLSDKLINLRVFPDANDKMNLSLLDTGFDLLLVSQFTLYGNCKNGRRPDFIDAAPPNISQPLYNSFIATCEKKLGKKVFSGIFGAKMDVHLINDGPVTFIIES